MAYLAVNKDGTEIISDYSLYRSGVEIMGESELIAHCDECGDNIYKDTLIID